MDNINRVLYVGIVGLILSVPVNSLAMIVNQYATQEDKRNYNSAKMVLCNTDLLPVIANENNRLSLSKTRTFLRLVCKDMAQQFTVTPCVCMTKFCKNIMAVSSWIDPDHYKNPEERDIPYHNNVKLFQCLGFALGTNDCFCIEECLKRLQCHNIELSGYDEFRDGGYAGLLRDLARSGRGRPATCKVVVEKDIFGLNGDPRIKKLIDELAGYYANADVCL